MVAKKVKLKILSVILSPWNSLNAKKSQCLFVSRVQLWYSCCLMNGICICRVPHVLSPTPLNFLLLNDCEKNGERIVLNPKALLALVSNNWTEVKA